MIKYKKKASQANFFLSENDMSFAAHHYMYVDPTHFNIFTLNDIIYAYQKYIKDKSFKLDPSIPKYLNINPNMKISEYINISNTNDYHLKRDKYYYVPIISCLKTEINDILLDYEYIV
jgi:hypothetical protein